MKDQYVILTGSKNNAGDYLIKYRAIQLFQKYRPDRFVIDYDGWKPFTNAQLEEINQSRALILTGGPALQKNMRPSVYPMTKNLEDIQVPVIMLGIGWKSPRGNWADTHNYPLSDETIKLLNKIENSGYFSSVRDFHTHNTLLSRGFKKFIMTGCPAWYSLDHINKPFDVHLIRKNISFSLGVSFVTDRRMKKQMQELILNLSNFFRDCNFTVVFHHSIDKKYLQVDNANKQFFEAHKNFISWLNKNEIGYLDVSGTADNMINHYSTCDLHIGYRVHAHIFMCSTSRPSILVIEDGRGKALKEVLGGVSIESYTDFSTNVLKKIMAQIGITAFQMKIADNLSEDIINNLNYEYEQNFPRFSATRINIDHHFGMMEKFLLQLP